MVNKLNKISPTSTMDAAAAAATTLVVLYILLDSNLRNLGPIRTDTIILGHGPLPISVATPLCDAEYLYGIGKNKDYTIQVRIYPKPGDLPRVVRIERGKRFNIPKKFFSTNSPLNELWGIIGDSTTMIPLLKLDIDSEGNPAMYVSGFIRLPDDIDE